MPDTLIEEVKNAFTASKEAIGGTSDGEVVFKTLSEVQNLIPPGSMGMKVTYTEMMLVITRRIYRLLAGATLPEEPAKMMELTAEKFMTPLTAAAMSAFSSGVMIGHRSEYSVRVAHHHGKVDELFADQEFADSSRTMAVGFAADRDVLQFFREYINGATEFLGHLTGFVHGDDASKVWDVWTASGFACASTAYLAGYQMGTSWYERDVLDGILIATEEKTDGSEGENSADL